LDPFQSGNQLFPLFPSETSTNAPITVIFICLGFLCSTLRKISSPLPELFFFTIYHCLRVCPGIYKFPRHSSSFVVCCLSSPLSFHIISGVGLPSLRSFDGHTLRVCRKFFFPLLSLNTQERVLLFRTPPSRALSEKRTLFFLVVRIFHHFMTFFRTSFFGSSFLPILRNPPKRPCLFE